MKIEAEYDAIVIGAGPAGSTFAGRLAEKGKKVIVIEKKKEIGSPVRCGEGVGLKGLERLGIHFCEKCSAGEIEGALLVSPDGREIRLKDKGTKGIVFERKIFDKHLAIEAAKKGANFLPHSMAESLLQKNEGGLPGLLLTVDGEEREVRAPLIVSAEGMEAKIAREMGFPVKYEPYDVDTCYEYEMANVEHENLIEIYFGSCAPRGYVWVFPKGKGVANVGIGIGAHLSGKKSAKDFLDEWIERNPNRFGGAKVIEKKAGIISVCAPMEEMAKDNFMVIGTAAKLVDPTHGGGIVLAIESGQIAAETALKAFETGDFSREALKEYGETWEKAEGEKLRKKLMLRKASEELNDGDWNFIFKELAGNEWGEVVGGSYKKAAAKIVLKRPQLLKVLKALM